MGCSGDPIPDPKPKLVPKAARTAVGQLELVLSTGELCVSLSSQAGDDSQPSGHSQVRSAWPGGKRRSLERGMLSNLPASQANSLALCLLG